MTPYDDLPSMAMFARVVQLRSFSAAARQIGVAKSAVSKRIAALEARLGVRLLVRTTRNLALTEDGLRFYEHCAQLVAAAEAAEDAVSESSHSARGPIRVNSGVAFAGMYLARAIARFLREYPEISVHLTMDDRFVDLAESGLDLVVRIAGRLSGSVVARRLATDRMVVCAAPGYLARAGTPATPEELIHHNCLRYALVPQTVEYRFRSGGKSFTVPTQGNFIAWSGTVLREAALGELGIAVIPRLVVATDLADGRLVSLLDEYVHGQFGVYAVMQHRKHVPARVRLLVDFLARHFAGGDWVALLAGGTGDRAATPSASPAARSAPPTRR